MTINNQQTEITYDWDGVPAELPIPFEIYDPIQVKWEVVDNGGAPSNVVAMVAKDADGNWVLNVTGGSPAEIKVWRETPITQEVDYNPYDAFPAETHEAALDKLTMIAQELEETKAGIDFVAENYVSKDGDMMNEGNAGIHMNNAQINGLKSPEKQNPYGAVNVKFYTENLIPGKAGPVGPPGPGVEPRPDPGLYPDWELPDTGPDYNPVFWVNDNELHSDYTLRPNANMMTAGPITIAESVTVDTNGGQWTVVGADESGAHYLGDLIDVTISEVPTDRHALMYDQDTDNWVPKLAPVGDAGPAPNVSASAERTEWENEPYVEITQDEPNRENAHFHFTIPEGPVGVTPEFTAHAFTGMVGTPADVTVTQVHPPEGDHSVHLQFSIPRGEKGEKGEGIDYRGSVPLVTDLPPPPLPDGTAYHVQEDDCVYAWSSWTNTWDNLGSLSGPMGPQGFGWKSGEYSNVDGKVTFTGDDASAHLTFTTDDIRGDGWSGGSYDESTGIVTFTSSPQNANNIDFQTTDIRGKGWTGTTIESDTASEYIVTFESDDGLEFTTPNLKGKGWSGTTVIRDDIANYVVEFESDDGLGFITANLKGPPGVDAYNPTVSSVTTSTKPDGTDAEASVTQDVNGDFEFDFKIPRGHSPAVNSVTTETGDPGTDAVVEVTSTPDFDLDFAFTVPEGIQGIQGIPGVSHYDYGTVVDTTVTGFPTLATKPTSILNGSRYEVQMDASKTVGAIQLKSTSPATPFFRLTLNEFDLGHTLIVVVDATAGFETGLLLSIPGVAKVLAPDGEIQNTEAGGIALYAITRTEMGAFVNVTQGFLEV